MYCNKVKFKIDDYRSFKEIVEKELTTLREIRDRYWDKVLLKETFPEDRCAMMIMLYHLEKEIMIKELNLMGYSK